MLAITGNQTAPPPSTTVNCAVGYPRATGPVGGREPINHVMPAWDLVCGQTAALGMLAADRHRTRTGEGSSMSLALSDVAFVAVSALGHVAEAQINGTERERFGNDLYGAYGTTFTTADGVIVYAVGISPKQWSGLLEATNATAAVAAIEAEHGVSFRDEGERFAHGRRSPPPSLRGSLLTASMSRCSLRRSRGLLGPSTRRSRNSLTTTHGSRSRANSSATSTNRTSAPISRRVARRVRRQTSGRADPCPSSGGAHRIILADVLGLSPAEIGSLHDDGVVAS